MKYTHFICAKCNGNTRTNHNSDSIADEIRNLNAKFDGFILNNHSEQNSIKTALDDIKNEMSSCFTEIRSDIKTCNDRINHVESNASSKLSDLQAEINLLHRRLNRADMLIGGLPAGIEDLLAPVLSLGTFFKVPISSSDISHVSYISKKAQILVKFNNVHARDCIMKEYFKTRSLKACDIMDGACRDLTNRVCLTFESIPRYFHLSSI
uniref:Uncharacterized protein n=1 Tax=Musca domestica TaxID=7370 RepID=A0A1I8NK19_MUSDO